MRIAWFRRSGEDVPVEVDIADVWRDMAAEIEHDRRLLEQLHQQEAEEWWYGTYWGEAT